MIIEATEKTDTESGSNQSLSQEGAEENLFPRSFD
jgi:hypothetical protein